jgi:hypothetical protein
MADFNDPFAVQAPYRTSSEDVVSPAQRSLARQRLTADPVSDAITKTSQRKSDLGRTLESMKLTRDQFLDTEGTGLFVSDPMTKKRMTNPDGSFVPQMGSQIEALRQRAQTRVGTLRGAFTPAVAGDLTDDAKAAAEELNKLEPTYKAQMQKYERIQEQMRRVQQAHDDTEIELGQLSMARVARTNPQLADDIFTAPQASIPATAPEVNQPPAATNMAAPAPAAAAEGPTFLGEVGKNAKDLGASFGVGANSLMKMVGDLYGLATGDMDNAVSRAGQYGVDYFNEMKSPEIRAAEAARKQKIDAADGEIGKALAYIRETVTNPMLLGSAVTEQLPNTVGTGGAGALVRVGAEKVLLKTLAAEAAKRMATKVGVGTAIATGAAMQGADVGANQYDELVTSLTEMPAAQAAQIPEIAEAMERGATLDEAKLALALTQARKTGAVAGGISLAAQALPGARTIERTIVGGGAGRSARGRIASAVAGAAGEAASEVIEEGGGQITKNVQARPVDPTREATAGLGETAGQALVTAAAMGGGAGALNGTGGAPDTTLGRQNGGAQVPPAPTATPAPSPADDTGGRVGGVEDRPAPTGPKPFDEQYRVSFTDAEGQPAAQYFDVESDQQAIEEFQRANPGIQTFDVRSPITPPTPVDAELQAELDAQTQAEAAPEPAPTPSAQPVQSPDVSVETVPRTVAEQPAVPASLPATQGPDSGAGSAPDEVAGVETAPAPAPTAQPIDAGDSDDLGGQAAQPASMPEGVATPDVGQTTAPNADVGAASPAPTPSVPATPLAEAQIGGPLSSQPPASASDSAQAPAPSPTPEPGPAARADFQLPRDLAGAKPRFNYRDKEFSLTFESELDKALFILAQKTPSKRDADFAREVTRQTGLSDADARKAGSLVREEIKAMAKEQGESGGLTVPVIHRASDFAPTTAPAPAPAPAAPKPISPQPTATATGPNSSLKKPQPPAAVAGGEKPSKKSSEKKAPSETPTLQPILPSKQFKAELNKQLDAAIEQTKSEDEFWDKAVAVAVKQRDYPKKGESDQRRFIRKIAADLAETELGTVTLKAGNATYRIVNTKEALSGFQSRIAAAQKPISMSNVRANTGLDASEAAVVKGYKEAKTEADKRGFLDGMSEGSLKNLGLDDRYVKVAPGVTMTKEAATALEKLRKGFKGEFEVEASTPTGETIDPAAPRGLSFVESSADALPAKTREDLANFEATLNRGRSAEAGRVSLRVRELGTESTDATRGESGNTAAAARLRRGLEEAFGKKIIFVEPTGNQRWAAITARQAPKTVLVNTNAASPFMALTGHEFTHNLQAERPDLYQRLGGFLDEFAPMPDSYSAEKTAQGYKEDKVRDEWIADVVGQRFDEPQFWKEAAAVAERRGAGEAFKQLARDAFEYLTKLGRRITMALSRKGTAPFLEEIDRIRSTIAKVLVDYSTGENMPAEAELMQMAASTPTTTAASEAVRAKYPDRFDDIPENHLPVEVKTASGEIIPATMYGYWDMRIIDGPISVGIGYFTEDGGITHSGIRDGDTLLTEVPPPADFGILASTPESADTNLSQSPRTERAAGMSVDDIEYNVRGHKDVNTEAKDFIDRHGETKAARVALDPADRSMPADTRTFVIGELMKRRVEKMKDAKTSPEEQESLARELQNLSASYNPQLRESAQQLSARQSLLSDARAGSIDQYVRDVQDEQDRAITPAGKKVVEEAKDELTKIDTPAIEKVAKAVAPKIDEIPLTKSLWQQYREDAAARVSDWVDGKTTPREEEAPLKVFTDRILAEIRTRLPKSKAEPGEAEQPASALLREAIENKEKYADVLKSVRDQVAEQYGENSRQMERVDMLLGDLGLKPYSKRLLDKAVKQAHDGMKTNVREIARMHYTQANRLHQDLAAALVNEAGLSKDRAKELAQDIEKRMRELTGEAKIKALAALKKRADATPRTRRIIDSITKSTELNNLGALSVSSLSDMVAKELKLPRASVETMRSLSQIADRIETAKSQSERSRAELDMARALRVARGITKTDVATSIWYANMLSGYTTQMANTLGNVMNGTLQLASVMATNPKHGAEALRGWIDGFGEGWAQGKAIIKSGRGSREFDARTGEAGNVLELVDYKRDFPDLNEKIASGLQTHAKLMRYVTRGMKAVDSIFYYPAREAYARVVTAKLLEGQYEGKELYQKTRELLGVAPDQLVAAKKQAEAEGFTGIDLSLRTANIIEEKRRTTAQGAQASDASERFALDTTFNNEPEGWAGVLYQGLVPLTESVRPGGVPILKTFLPFLRVPTNVFNASMNFTPQGAVRALRGMPLGVTRGKDGKYHVERREFTKDERNRLLAQSIGGSLTMAGLTALALGAGNDEGEEPWFDITATGPDDFRKRQQLEATGWRPHSVKFGDTWVSYKDSPLLLPLSISGHVVDAVRYKKQDDELTLGSKVTDAVMTAPRAIFETSMLSGLGTMMDFASGNASAKQVEGFLARTVMTAAIPNLATQIDRTFNPETREANGPLGAVGAAVPFLRNTGDVKTDVLGEPVERGPMRRFGSIEENDPLREVLRDKKVFISTPSRDTKLGNGPMDEDQYREFVRTSGERINQRLRPFTATLRRMTPEQAERAVDKVVRDERERAKNNIRARMAPAGR